MAVGLRISVGEERSDEGLTEDETLRGAGAAGRATDLLDYVSVTVGTSATLAAAATSRRR